MNHLDALPASAIDNTITCDITSAGNLESVRR